MRHDVVMTGSVDEQARKRLLSHVRRGLQQEDLCFALWRPSTGSTRRSALVFQVVPPESGERHLHGNASFDSGYLTRSVRIACEKKAGLAFMHNHLTTGWQGMSDVDVVAERDRISPPARATGLPLIGMTLGTDGSWSARVWIWDGRRFNRRWCDKVRVAGQRLRVTFNDKTVPPPRRRKILRRTIDTWGDACQRDLARLRVGVVGLGSVGCMVAEALARMGIQQLVLIDPDRVETHNLDRLLHAGQSHVGDYKAELVARSLRNSATAENFDVQAYTIPVQHETAFLAALDCDILFSAVDRPLPKDLVNRIAYAHCIPVISGGVFIDNKPDGSLGQAAWSVTTVGPGQRCLRCDGQYTSSDVVMERDGSLDDPAYVRDPEHHSGVPTNQNVFSFSASLASFMVNEMVRLTVAADWWPNVTGKLHYSLIPNRLQTERNTCGANCSVYESIALGDEYRYPFIVKEERETTASESFFGRLWNRFRKQLTRRRN